MTNIIFNDKLLKVFHLRQEMSQSFSLLPLLLNIVLEAPVYAKNKIKFEGLKREKLPLFDDTTVHIKNAKDSENY